MPNVHDLFPSPWVSAQDLKGKPCTVTIETVTIEGIRNPRTGKNELRIVLAFYKAKKRMILNKTQAFTLASITASDETEAWIGHTVTLAPAAAPNGKATIEIRRGPTAPPPMHTEKTASPADAEDNPFDDEEHIDMDPITAGDWQ